jgi:hypothetical protein
MPFLDYYFHTRSLPPLAADFRQPLPQLAELDIAARADTPPICRVFDAAFVYAFFCAFDIIIGAASE